MSIRVWIRGSARGRRGGRREKGGKRKRLNTKAAKDAKDGTRSNSATQQLDNPATDLPE